MALNVKLLRKIKKHILEEPRRFVMRTFVYRRNESFTKFEGDGGATVRFASCGTAACIGGWAVILADGLKAAETDGIRQRATALLGLPRDASDRYSLHDEVFEASCWPEPFAAAYQAAKTQTQRVKIAAERIDHLIATGK